MEEEAAKDKKAKEKTDALAKAEEKAEAAQRQKCSEEKKRQREHMRQCADKLKQDALIKQLQENCVFKYQTFRMVR